MYDDDGTYPAGYSRTYAASEAGGSWLYYVYGTENTFGGPNLDDRVYLTSYYDWASGLTLMPSSYTQGVAAGTADLVGGEYRCHRKWIRRLVWLWAVRG